MTLTASLQLDIGPFRGRNVDVSSRIENVYGCFLHLGYTNVTDLLLT